MSIDKKNNNNEPDQEKLPRNENRRFPYTVKPQSYERRDGDMSANPIANDEEKKSIDKRAKSKSDRRIDDERRN